MAQVELIVYSSELAERDPDGRTSALGTFEKLSSVPGFMVEEFREGFRLSVGRQSDGWVVLDRRWRWIGLPHWRRLLRRAMSTSSLGWDETDVVHFVERRR